MNEERVRLFSIIGPIEYDTSVPEETFCKLSKKIYDAGFGPLHYSDRPCVASKRINNMTADYSIAVSNKNIIEDYQYYNNIIIIYRHRAYTNIEHLQLDFSGDSLSIKNLINKIKETCFFDALYSFDDNVNGDTAMILKNNIYKKVNNLTTESLILGTYESWSKLITGIFDYIFAIKVFEEDYPSEKE